MTAVRAIAPGWRAAGADVLVTTPQRALEGVETSELKLAGVETLVITDAAGIFAVSGDGLLETLVPAGIALAGDDASFHSCHFSISSHAKFVELVHVDPVRDDFINNSSMPHDQDAMADFE